MSISAGYDSGMKPDPALTDAAHQLIATYRKVHPELGLTEALWTATLTAGGIRTSTTDDGRGRLTLSDDAGNVIVSLDVSPWIDPATEA